MRLTLTVVDPARPASARRHVTVEAPAGTTFGTVRADLARAAELAHDEFAVDGRALTDAAPVGEAPLLHGALLVAGAPGSQDALRRDGAVVVRVTGGVGAGATFTIGRGEHIIGRATSASLRLDDSGVSRAHAVIDVRADGVHVHDLEPTNRSRLDDAPLPEGGATWADGQRLRLGSTTLVLGAPSVTSGHHDVADGRVLVHRPPRLGDRVAPLVVVFPEAPRRVEHARMPLLASFAPLVLSAALALALASPALLLFALMSPVLLLGQWWSDRRAGRVSHRRQVRAHAIEVERAHEELASARLSYAASQRRVHPDLTEVASVVRRRGTRLWERRPTDGDHLVVRVGTARQPAPIECPGLPADTSLAVPDLPAVLDLQGLGVVGVAGPRAACLPLVGAMAFQVAAWHSPRHVDLHVIASAAAAALDWEWTALLPHVGEGDTTAARVTGDGAAATRIGELNALVEARREAGSTAWASDHRTPADVVVVLDGAADLRSVPGLSDLLAAGPAHGITFVCLDESETGLPAECRATVGVDATGLVAMVREEGRTLEGVVPDLPPPGWLEANARALAPLVDATPSTGTSSLPRHVSFAGLHRAAGLEPLTAEGVTAAWATHSGRPSVLLGRTAQAPMVLDLASDGPHLLVGGTTGSGKSELLQALVAGLAVRNRPDDLAFVLVDYKGGSAFGEAAGLPHTVGLVTDLDGQLAARALTSLAAEMKRRERMLAAAGAKDHDAYREAAVCRDLPPLARLVIVVDEFKALADELPDFVAGLVRIAALGRSLGLHLVLATQRPAGIVSADMRANLSLRIAMRVRDRADSDDLVEAPDAALLDVRAPGRACLRNGDAALTTLQTAYLGGPLPAEPGAQAPVRVTVHDAHSCEASPSPVVASRRAREGGPTELTAFVDAVRRAHHALGIQAAPAPWQPPLPQVVRSCDLDAVPGDVSLGMVDSPHEQSRLVLRWRPGRDGHLGIAGGPRSGRSTALLTVALGLADADSTEDVHVHVVQGARGPCATLAGLPWVGTVTTSADPALTVRLLRRLVRVVDGTEPLTARTVLLVDGWETVEERLAGIDHGAGVDDLYRLLRDGGPAGIHLVVTGGRALVTGRLPGLLDRRLVLQMPDPLDLMMAGVDPVHATAVRPPGRAVDLRDGREVQLAVPGEDAGAESTAAAIARASAQPAAHATVLPDPPGDANASSMPLRLAELPGRVRLQDLPAVTDVPDGLVVGVGGDTAAPVAVDGVRHRRLLVAGPRRSGRSSALVVIGEQLRLRGESVLCVCSGRSPLAAWGALHGVPVLSPKDDVGLVTARRADHALSILVDDVEELERTATEDVLLEAVRLVGETNGRVVVAAELGRVTAAFRGPVPEVARDGGGILLSPGSPTDGDVLGVRLDGPLERRPGRGWLVLDGEAVPLQAAIL